MSYSIDGLLVGVANLVALGVGDDLHGFSDGSGGTRPAVFIKKATAQADGRYHGLLPFCVITSNGRTQQGAVVSGRSYNSITGDQELRTIYDHDITLNFYGGDAEQIASDMEAFLASTEALEYMCTLGLGITASYGINPSTTVLDGVVHDFAALQIKLTVVGTYTQPVYEMITVEGQIRYRYPDSEVDVLTSDLTIP